MNTLEEKVFVCRLVVRPDRRHRSRIPLARRWIERSGCERATTGEDPYGKSPLYIFEDEERRRQQMFGIWSPRVKIHELATSSSSLLERGLFSFFLSFCRCCKSNGNRRRKIIVDSLINRPLSQNRQTRRQKGIICRSSYIEHPVFVFEFQYKTV